MLPIVSKALIRCCQDSHAPVTQILTDFQKGQRMTSAWASSQTQKWFMALGALAVIGAASTHIAVARSHRASLYEGYGQTHARTIMGGMGYRHWFSSGLQCVPFARDNSGIELTGNANTWWSGASGIYERGARPEVGSVLNFRASGRMRLGHVAVVSNVLDGRNVEIDHANWSGRGSVRRNVRVVDVSASNDWSAVRVALGNGDFGSVYPTYGFIYDRPDRGTMIANSGVANAGVANAGVASQGMTNTGFGGRVIAMTAPAMDFRPAPERVLVSLAPMADEEVAEASDDAPRGRRSEWRHGRSLRSSHVVPVMRGYATNRRGESNRGYASYRGYVTSAMAESRGHTAFHAGHPAPVRHGRHRA